MTTDHNTDDDEHTATRRRVLAGIGATGIALTAPGSVAAQTNTTSTDTTGTTPEPTDATSETWAYVGYEDGSFDVVDLAGNAVQIYDSGAATLADLAALPGGSIAAADFDGALYVRSYDDSDDNDAYGTDGTIDIDATGDPHLYAGAPRDNNPVALWNIAGDDQPVAELLNPDDRSVVGKFSSDLFRDERAAPAGVEADAGFDRIPVTAAHKSRSALIVTGYSEIPQPVTLADAATVTLTNAAGSSSDATVEVTATLTDTVEDRVDTGTGADPTASTVTVTIDDPDAYVTAVRATVQPDMDNPDDADVTTITATDLTNDGSVTTASVNLNDQYSEDDLDEAMRIQAVEVQHTNQGTSSDEWTALNSDAIPYGVEFVRAATYGDGYGVAAVNNDQGGLDALTQIPVVTTSDESNYNIPTDAAAVTDSRVIVALKHDGLHSVSIASDGTATRDWATDELFADARVDATARTSATSALGGGTYCAVAASVAGTTIPDDADADANARVAAYDDTGTVQWETGVQVPTDDAGIAQIDDITIDADAIDLNADGDDKFADDATVVLRTPSDVRVLSITNGDELARYDASETIVAGDTGHSPDAAPAASGGGGGGAVNPIEDEYYGIPLAGWLLGGAAGGGLLYKLRSGSDDPRDPEH